MISLKVKGDHDFLSMNKGLTMYLCQTVNMSIYLIIECDYFLNKQKSQQ